MKDSCFMELMLKTSTISTHKDSTEASAGLMVGQLNFKWRKFLSSRYGGGIKEKLSST